MRRGIAIVGPTACGKTRRAVEIASAFDGEIISADSRQIYRGMDIGTGKDLEEYGSVKYHLIDIRDAGDKYNLHQYLRDFRLAWNDIQNRGLRPIVCGGSGMYVENALAGLILPEVPENRTLREKLRDKSLPELTEILKRYKTLHNTTDVDTSARAVRAIEICDYYQQHPEEAKSASTDSTQSLDCVVLGLDISRELRRKRISERLQTRMEQGMVEEVKGLLDSGIPAEDLIYYGLEYKFVTEYLIGLYTYDEMKRRLEIAIHQFAKRQMTWFRGMERRGIPIHWLPFDIDSDRLREEANCLLENIP